MQNANGTPHDIVIYFRRGLYYSRVWFLFDRQKTMDMLCVLRRQLPDGHWRFDYRFRYYNDRQAFDSSDRKNFYAGEFPDVADEAEVVRKLNEAIPLIAQATDLVIDETVIESDDPDVIIEKMRKKQYFTMRADASGVLQ